MRFQGLDISEQMSAPQLFLPHHSGAAHHHEIWLPPGLSAHSPCCKDEASSISSPVTLCKEEKAGITSADCRPSLYLSPALVALHRAALGARTCFPEGPRGHPPGLKGKSSGCRKPSRVQLPPQILLGPSRKLREGQL